MKQKKNFALIVEETSGSCAVGEKLGSEHMLNARIPVISCEGACIRGEIARLAAHLVAREEPYRRGCHGEMFTVPQSAIAKWGLGADRVVVIDGCFLKCHGRILKNLTDEDSIFQFDALSVYKKYTDVFNIDDVPEEERKRIARQVADKVLADLKQGKVAEGPASVSISGGCSK